MFLYQLIVLEIDGEKGLEDECVHEYKHNGKPCLFQYESNEEGERQEGENLKEIPSQEFQLAENIPESDDV